MQKVNAHSLEKALAVVLEDEMNLMQSIIKAHEETCDYTKDKVAPLLEAARSRPIYAQCPQMVSLPFDFNYGQEIALKDFYSKIL